MTWAAILTFAKRIPAWAWVTLGAVLMLFAAFVWHNSQVSEAASDGIQKGAQQQRETDLVETINRVETANETREAIQGEMRAGSGDALYRQCLRAARTPANCQRFLRGGEAADR